MRDSQLREARTSAAFAFFASFFGRRFVPTSIIVQTQLAQNDDPL